MVSGCLECVRSVGVVGGLCVLCISDGVDVWKLRRTRRSLGRNNRGPRSFGT